MIIALLIILELVLVGLLWSERRAHRQAHDAWREASAARWHAERAEARAIERLHAVSNSALRGAPAVYWTHPNDATGESVRYLKVMIAGEWHLFTPLAQHEARRVATLHLPPVRHVGAEPPPQPDLVG